MTIAIAALSNYEEEIVLVNDAKVALGSTSADKAVMKNEPLIGRYAVLIAGNDVARAQPVIERTRAHFPKLNIALSPTEISEALFEECVKERNKVAEASVLRRHGFTWEQFTTQGKNLCTDAVYYDIQAELGRVDLSLDFIIAGFDEKKRPHIRATNWNTPPEDYTTLGFYAIGSGAPAAISSLAHAVEYLGFQRWSDTGEVLYHVLAAKFMAEAAQDVGKATWAMAIGAEGHRHLSALGADEFVRKQWLKAGAPRVPKGIGPVIEELMHRSAGELLKREVMERMAKHLPLAKKMLKAISKDQQKSDAKKAGQG